MFKYDEDFLEVNFKELINKIVQHFTMFANGIDFAGYSNIENYRLMELMNILQNTAQSWRDKRLITFCRLTTKFITTIEFRNITN
jgi:hypothetical protein